MKDEHRLRPCGETPTPRTYFFTHTCVFFFCFSLALPKWRPGFRAGAKPQRRKSWGRRFLFQDLSTMPSRSRLRLNPCHHTVLTNFHTHEKERSNIERLASWQPFHAWRPCTGPSAWSPGQLRRHAQGGGVDSSQKKKRRARDCAPPPPPSIQAEEHSKTLLVCSLVGLSFRVLGPYIFF